MDSMCKSISPTIKLFALIRKVQVFTGTVTLAPCRPCIWIPQEEDTASGVATATRGASENRLVDLCADISRTVVSKVQANMTQATADSTRLLSHIEKELSVEQGKRAIKSRWGRYVLLLSPWLLVLIGKW